MERYKNKFLQAGTILFILNVLASALNYFCQLVMAKVLSIESYGTINTIFSFMMIVAVPGTTLTMVVAKYYAGNNSDKIAYFRKQLHVVLLLTVLVFMSLFFTKRISEQLLSIDDTIVLVAAFILASLGYFQPLYTGIFSGNKLFVLVGLYSLCIPLYKLIAIGTAYIFGSTDKIRLYFVLAIMIMGMVITAFYGHIKTKKILGIEEKVQGKIRLYTLNDFNTLILNVSLVLYTNIDLLAVRYYGSGVESGLYSSVLLFGRIIYYFATTLGTILLPSVACEESPKVRKRTLNKVLALMMGFAIICILPINIFKNFFIILFYGREYLEAAKYVIFVSIISLSLSIYTIMINYVVGIGNTTMATVIMLAVDILLIGVVIFLNNISDILLAIGVIGIIGASVIYCFCSICNENSKRSII